MDCWSEEDSSFEGKDHIEINLGLKDKEIIEVAVLGWIICTDMALLQDSSSHIWLYNVPDAVDPYFEGMKARLALINFQQDRMIKHIKLSFMQQYENIIVDVKDFTEFDEEEDD